MIHQLEDLLRNLKVISGNVGQWYEHISAGEHSYPLGQNDNGLVLRTNVSFRNFNRGDRASASHFS
jgi:hypothetical protein